jgi:hypothetical protein
VKTVFLVVMILAGYFTMVADYTTKKGEVVIAKTASI